ncbi:MAG: DUF58 domain-containing protein [Acidaminobacteraceae bacterium]
MNNKGTFLIIIFMSMILSFITGGKTFYNTWIFLLIILGLNYIIVKKNIKNIDSNFVINREIHIVSQEVKFKYILVNKSLIPIHMAKVNLILSKEFGFISSEVENVSFRSNQIIELKRSFICEKRGYYELGKLEVEIRDVFSLFIKRKILDKSISIKVYPRIVEIDHIDTGLSGFLGNVKSNRPSMDDFTNVKSIREYNIFDNPRNIHFKLSAKGDKTYIKEYYDSNYLDIIIIVDGFSSENSKNESEEMCVSISLSIAKYVLDKAGEVQYILNSKSNLNTKLTSISDFSNLLEKLVTSKFDGDKCLDYFLGNISRNIRKNSDFIIVTRYIDELIVEKIITMQSRGSNVSIYLIDYTEMSDVIERDRQSMILSLEQNGISIYLVGNLDQL